MGRGLGKREMTPIRLGDPVALVWTKWWGVPHWVHESVWLGTDQFGTWLGQFSGTRSRRPGWDNDSPSDMVRLVPNETDWVATFPASDHPLQVEVYVDIAINVRLSRNRLTAIDMDLDVVRRAGQTGIADRDEFEVHRKTYGYPEYLVLSVTATADRIARLVAQHEEPFDTATSEAWLNRLAALRREP